VDPSKELLEALMNGDVVKVKELLERGADANVKDSSGATPLHYVAISYVDEIGAYIAELARALTVNIIRASHKAPRCPKCGMPLEPGAKFCGYCGAKIAE